MSLKRAKQAAEIEKRLQQLEGPEWEDSDDEKDKDAAAAPKADGKQSQKDAAAASEAKAVKRRRTEDVAPGTKKSRVIYIGHVPHGCAPAMITRRLRRPFLEAWHV
jgi:hypothetical protein